MSEIEISLIFNIAVRINLVHMKAGSQSNRRLAEYSQNRHPGVVRAVKRARRR